MNSEKKQKNLSDAINALGAIFLERIPKTMDSMEAELHAIALDKNNQLPWKTLHHLLHTMAGSAGMFNYNELGSRARALEIRINTILKEQPDSVEDFLNDHHAFIAWARQNYVKTN